MCNVYNVEFICPMCKRTTILKMSERQYLKYQQHSIYRTLSIQELFPELSASVRELMLSGLCSKCQDKVFGE